MVNDIEDLIFKINNGKRPVVYFEINEVDKVNIKAAIESQKAALDRYLIHLMGLNKEFADVPN